MGDQYDSAFTDPNAWDNIVKAARRARSLEGVVAIVHKEWPADERA
jgi:hypothetical protein